MIRASNGGYAVALGPQAVATGGGRAVLDKIEKTLGAPMDALLSHGETFMEVVWAAPAPAVIRSLHYDGKTDALLKDRDLS